MALNQYSRYPKGQAIAPKTAYIKSVESSDGAVGDCTTSNVMTSTSPSSHTDSRKGNLNRPVLSCRLCR